MDVLQVIREMDGLYELNKPDAVEPFLLEKMEEARAERDYESLVTLLNEGIGYYRDRAKYDKCLLCCREARKTLDEMGMKGSVPYATTLLNIATAYRAAGMLDASMEIYREVFQIYEERLDRSDYLFASLYNNISLLYEQKGDYNSAISYLDKALDIVKGYPEQRISLATSHVNMACALLKTSRWEQAEDHLKKAFEIFLQDERKDFHYGMALAAMGEFLYRKQEYEEAEKMILLAMQKLESHVGRTDSYRRLEENLKEIRRKLGKA